MWPLKWLESFVSLISVPDLWACHHVYIAASITTFMFKAWSWAWRKEPLEQDPWCPSTPRLFIQRIMILVFKTIFSLSNHDTYNCTSHGRMLGNVLFYNKYFSEEKYFSFIIHQNSHLHFILFIYLCKKTLQNFMYIMYAWILNLDCNILPLTCFYWLETFFFNQQKSPLPGSWGGSSPNPTLSNLVSLPLPLLSLCSAQATLDMFQAYFFQYLFLLCMFFVLSLRECSPFNMCFFMAYALSRFTLSSKKPSSVGPWYPSLYPS